MTTQRVIDFLKTERPPSPCLVVDLECVAENYRQFAAALPGSPIFYAVKANPAAEILRLLTQIGSSFDAASVLEIEQVLAAGAEPACISYGSTIKKERDIARAFALGVDMFAADSLAEVEKLARAAPGSKIFCRILADGAGADWSLGRKFGCSADMAADVLEAAQNLGLRAYGLSFHVGSQQPDAMAFDRSLEDSAGIFRALEARGINLSMINLGGGFPAQYTKIVPDLGTYAETITASLRRHFGNRIPRTIVEPGRGIVGDAGTIKTEVVLISRKSYDDPMRWVYLDIGKFGGLAETMDEAIRYPINTPHDGGPTEPCIIAGPTCDTVDVLYENDPYLLPLGLEIGDELLIDGTGAYTATYATVGFNGIPPLQTYVI